MTETIPLSTYIDVNSFTIVVITCGIFAAASHLSGSTKAFAVLRDIGIPLGLFEQCIAESHRLCSGVQLHGADAYHCSV